MAKLDETYLGELMSDIYMIVTVGIFDFLPQIFDNEIVADLFCSYVYGFWCVNSDQLLKRHQNPHMKERIYYSEPILFRACRTLKVSNVRWAINFFSRYKNPSNPSQTVLHYELTMVNAVMEHTVFTATLEQASKG